MCLPGEGALGQYFLPTLTRCLFKSRPASKRSYKIISLATFHGVLAKLCEKPLLPTNNPQKPYLTYANMPFDNIAVRDPLKMAALQRC